jgi:hypothetical protein
MRQITFYILELRIEVSTALLARGRAAAAALVNLGHDCTVREGKGGEKKAKC